VYLSNVSLELTSASEVGRKRESQNERMKESKTKTERYGEIQRQT